MFSGVSYYLLGLLFIKENVPIEFQQILNIKISCKIVKYSEMVFATLTNNLKPF